MRRRGWSRLSSVNVVSVTAIVLDSSSLLRFVAYLIPLFVKVARRGALAGPADATTVHRLLILTGLPQARHAANRSATVCRACTAGVAAPPDSRARRWRHRH